jgi:ABC-type branched-subunit amino acid transport system permease subunit/ABC-type branched-subunit amino acid transport system ATPase component
VLLYVCGLGSSSLQYNFGLVLIYGLSALGLDWLMGRAGQVSIGNGALMAVGAFVTAAVADKPWAPFPVPLLVSGAAGAIAGLLIAMPSLRLKGIYFALVTLALQFMVLFGAREYEQHIGQVSGLAVAPPKIAGYVFSFGPSYILMLAVIVGLVMLLLYSAYQRLPGRMWRAIRESELAASTIQVDVRRWKLSAFVGSSAVISVSGSLLAYYTGVVSSDSFTLTFAISFVVMIIVGGVGSMSGALFGAMLVTLAPVALSHLSNLDPNSVWLTSNLPVIQDGIYGLLVLIVLLFLPKGVLPSLYDLAGRTRNRARAKASNRVPAMSVTRRAEPAGQSGAQTRGGVDAAGALRIQDLQVRYANGAQALGGVELAVGFGDVIAVVGRNGAGKSTLLRSLGGFFATENVSSSGSATFDGHELIGASPLANSRLGVVLVPERDKVFPSLTVADHIRHIGDVDAAREALPEVWPIIEKRWKSQAGLLSGGERQLLALAMAASLEPRLLLVDEMSLGLAPVMTQRVADAICQLRAARPMTIVIVEQNVAIASRLAERVYKLEGGRLSQFVDDDIRAGDAVTAKSTTPRSAAVS